MAVSSKAASAGATATKSSTKASTSATGAPAQRSQGSRKGKRAWRKNVDLDVVEEALEEARAEERVTGSRLYEKKDDELFQVDTTGDERLRKALPKINPKLLTSTRILSQRSAVPAVASRATATQKRKLSYADKERLLRVGKRARRGPLDSYQDETEFGKGSALLELSEAAKRSGEYNVWEEEEEEELPEGAAKRKPKAPKHVDPRDAIALAAISDPHQGTSYNPTVDAHTALLDAARVAEEQRLADTQRFAGIKEKFASASAPPHAPDVPPGMVVAAGDGAEDEDDEEPEGWAGVRAPRAVPKPKTKQQRARKLKLLEEKRALEQKIANKRMLASVTLAKSLRKSLEKGQVVHAQTLLEREAKLREKLRGGLGGSKLGRHRVGGEQIDVQLGEDLTESLRGLKPEGNLFRDRFLSLQQRGLTEPRALVLGQKRQARVKEYEKHAWKRFE